MYQFLLEADLSGDFHEQLLYQKCKQFLNSIVSFVMSAPSLTKFIQVEIKSLVQDFFRILIMTQLQQAQYLSPRSSLLKCIVRAMWLPIHSSLRQKVLVHLECSFGFLTQCYQGHDLPLTMIGIYKKNSGYKPCKLLWRTIAKTAKASALVELKA